MAIVYLKVKDVAVIHFIIMKKYGECIWQVKNVVNGS